MIPGVDYQRSTWRALKGHITAKIAELHLHLEAPGEPDHTNMLRGQIKALRSLVDAVEAVVPVKENTETTGPLY